MKTLYGLLSDKARDLPAKTCIKFGKTKISYLDADRMVNLMSGGLTDAGVRPGDRVAILMQNCPEYIISYFGILRSGGIAVPLNTFLIAEEISYILRDSGCTFLIYGEHFRSRVDEVKRRVQGLQAFKPVEIPGKSPGPPPRNGDGVAVLLYTSGTTGFPKGAMLTHGNLISNVQACKQVMHISHTDRVLLFLPLFHSFSFTVCVLVPIFSGASIVLLESVKPFSKVLNSIFRDKITLFVAVPTVYTILSRKKIPFFARHLLKYLVKIRACVSGAAALPEMTIRSFEERFNIPLLEGYGLTEASPVVAVNPLEGIRKPGSVGLPLPGVEVAVLDDNGRKVGAGMVGELAVRGPNVMKGYFNREEESRETLREGWLHTGDMARLDEDGYIYIVDRKKDLIIVDGMNIYPREVEDAALHHPAIEECAMIGVPDGRGSEVSTLFVKKKDGSVLEEGQVRAHLKGRVAPYKVPRKVVFVEEFPRTATGKIRKNELRKCNK